MGKAIKIKITIPSARLGDVQGEAEQSKPCFPDEPGRGEPER